MEYYLGYEPLIIKKPTSQWDNFYYIENGFDKENIKKLEDLIKNYKFSKGMTGDIELGTTFASEYTNNRDIAYINPTTQTKWLYDLLVPFALEANENLFHFDINTVTDSIHYVIYPKDNGHLTWHMDVSQGDSNRRKLAMTIQLSDPSEYEGGDFQIWRGGNEFITVTRKKGDIIIFPTFLMHRVTPITKGIDPADGPAIDNGILSGDPLGP